MAFVAPDVLVLGAGGVLGEAWLSGTLAGIEDAAGLDLAQVEAVVGTSAGSIVAARLTSGRSPRRPRRGGDEHDRPDPSHPADPAVSGLVAATRRAGRVASTAAFAAAVPVAPLAMATAAPGGALIRGAMLSRLPRPAQRLDALREEVDRWAPSWDGRLRVCVVDRTHGRRVVLGASGSPRATPGQAVAASCAVPWLFAPVTVDGREYVDGGVWSPTNLDAAPARRGTQVLCLTPTGGGLAPRSVWGVLRAAGRAGAEVESAALRRRGARVSVVGPDARASAEMGDDLMNPAGVDRVLAAGFAQGRRLVAGPRAARAGAPSKRRPTSSDDFRPGGRS